MKRRQALKTTALGAAFLGSKSLALAQTAASTDTPKAPPSDRIRVGVIGTGNFGTADMRQFLSHADVEVAAACDVFKPNLEKGVAATNGKAKAYGDFRRILDDKEIDAVVIATPEHWHAYMAIEACLAGKDVYLEKPCAHNIHDGRLIVAAAREKNRIVQVGTQQRSGSHFQRVVKYVQEGKIGEVTYASVWTHFPPRPAATPVTGGPPEGMDWDMWLGPARKLPYDEVWNIGRRGYWDFWGGDVTEWGTHLVDIVLWAMNAQFPETTVAVGGLFHRKFGEIPDTMQISYRFPKFVLHFSVLHHNTYGLNGDPGPARFGSYGMQFQGTKGTLFVDRGGYRITPQPTQQEEPNRIAGSSGPDMRAPGYYYTSEISPEVSNASEQHQPHVRNFLDSVKSRKRAIADIEDGYYANTTCRLGNIAYRLGRAVKWDAAKQEIVGDKEATQMAVGTYRDPWKPKGL